MSRSLAQGHRQEGPGDPGRAGGAGTVDRRLEIGGAVAFAALALFAYTVGDEGTLRYYNHFVWQALAFLDGRAAIEYPVEASGDLPGNAFFQDVLALTDATGAPTGFGLIPFPPLPAIVLMPFVALWGIRTDAQAIAGVLGALDVAICWWMLGRLRIGTASRVATTLFFGFGTVFFYTAELGTTWYQAHVVAVGLAMLVVGLALGWDRDSAREDADAPEAAAEAEPRGLRSVLGLIDRRQVAAGFLFGLACTARLTVVFAAPFLVLVGAGRGWLGRGISGAIGAAIPVAALLGYNVVSTGQLFHPAYEHLYQAEALGYPTLGYNLEWGIEDPRYIPQNLQIALLSTPVLFPERIPAALGEHTDLCTEPGVGRGLFEEDCPIALPRDTGMSILLTSPAFLLALPAIGALYGRSRLVTAGLIAVVLVFLVNLMHFSQGWVQFGYRFANDFLPFALPLVALGVERLRDRPVIVWGLIAVSIAVNLWGAAWGALLGW